MRSVRQGEPLARHEDQQGRPDGAGFGAEPGASSPWPRPYSRSTPVGKGDVPPRLPPDLQSVVQASTPRTALTPGPSDPSYIFALHHYWPGDPDVNELRARFIEVTKGVGRIALRRWLVCSDHDQMLGHDDLLHRHLVPSMVAADPEFGGRVQHPGRERVSGMEFGEYLALGKAIIELPSAAAPRRSRARHSHPCRRRLGGLDADAIERTWRRQLPAPAWRSTLGLFRSIRESSSGNPASRVEFMNPRKTPGNSGGRPALPAKVYVSGYPSRNKPP